MNSGASRQRRSFSDTQPFCRIMSEAHSVFQIRVAFSISDGSILMWMRRMIDIGVLLTWLCNRRERKHRRSRTAAVRSKSPQAAAAEEALAAACRRDSRRISRSVIICGPIATRAEIVFARFDTHASGPNPKRPKHEDVHSYT